jgi:rhodanese-related sulfurtransferase
MGQGRAVPVCKAFARGCAWSMITAKARHVYPRANHIPFDEFRALMLNDARRSSSTLLDVRSLEEYSVSHLRGAVWADEKCTSYELATLLPDCDRPIYCYCSFGFRSGRVAEILQEMGYRNVYNVEGALFMWLNTGGDVWRGSSKLPEPLVHPMAPPWHLLLQPHVRVASDPLSQGAVHHPAAPIATLRPRCPSGIVPYTHSHG